VKEQLGFKTRCRRCAREPAHVEWTVCRFSNRLIVHARCHGREAVERIPIWLLEDAPGDYLVEVFEHATPHTLRSRLQQRGPRFRKVGRTP
jgi:hypothetical protein